MFFHGNNSPFILARAPDSILKKASSTLLKTTFKNNNWASTNVEEHLKKLQLGLNEC
jgi:hypothetical protein